MPDQDHIPSDRLMDVLGLLGAGGIAKGIIAGPAARPLNALVTRKSKLYGQSYPDLLPKAEEMLKAGEPARKILAETRWYPRSRGGMGFELPDREARIADPKYSGTKLGDFLHYKKAFEAYPEFRDISLSFDPKKTVDYAQPDIANNQILMGGKAFNLKDKDLQTASLLGAMQHFIQNREGWSTSPANQYALERKIIGDLSGLKNQTPLKWFTDPKLALSDKAMERLPSQVEAENVVNRFNLSRAGNVLNPDWRSPSNMMYTDMGKFAEDLRTSKGIGMSPSTAPKDYPPRLYQHGKDKPGSFTSVGSFTSPSALGHEERYLYDRLPMIQDNAKRIVGSTELPLNTETVPKQLQYDFWGKAATPEAIANLLKNSYP